MLRQPVCDALIDSFSRKNAIIGAAVFIPGVDMPVLTVNQIRMVLRIARRYGRRRHATRARARSATIGVGFGFRTLARQLLAFVPVAGWVVQGGVAYLGTRAARRGHDPLLRGAAGGYAAAAA